MSQFISSFGTSTEQVLSRMTLSSSIICILEIVRLTILAFIGLMRKKELPLVFLYLLLWDLFKFYFPLEAIIVSIRALFSCSYAVSSKTQQAENQNTLLQNRPLENYLLTSMTLLYVLKNEYYKVYLLVYKHRYKHTHTQRII